MKPLLSAITVISIFFLGSCFNSRKTGNATSNNKTVKIAVISDLNSRYGSVTYNKEVAEVIEELSRLKPDIIVCAGDMVAGQKASLTEENIRAMWQSFKQTVLTPLQAANIPFGFTLGNHDASPSYKLDRSIAQQFWQQNVQAANLQFVDSSHYPFYFSYLHNNIFFISWDAAAARVPQPVYEWMQEQLNSQPARTAALRMLLGHLPLYAIVAAKNKPGEVNAAPDSALQFFKNNGIDLYISGHQHAWYPAKKQGLQLLNAGCIGDGERPILGHDSIARKAYTIIEVPVKDAKKFRYTTYNPVNKQIIDAGILPDSVVGFNGVLQKDDR